MHLPEFFVEWVDPTPYLAAGQAVQTFLERPLLHGEQPKGGLFNSAEVARSGTYHTVVGNLLEDEPAWSLTKEGQYVRIPLVWYRTADRAPAMVWGLGYQLGWLAAYLFRFQSNELPKKVHLFLGTVCTDLAPQENAYRCYVGLSIEV